jgi:uncharacterized protein YndB with AHSA1/START domain
MEFGTIEREIYVEAAPEVVFAVVSRPEHIGAWWGDVDPDAGTITFGPDKVWPLTVVTAEPPRTFAFRWAHSLLVTFELTPSGDGTVLRMTETGFREQGWDEAVLRQRYREHATGWEHFLPRLAAHAATVTP